MIVYLAIVAAAILTDHADGKTAARILGAIALAGFFAVVVNAAWRREAQREALDHEGAHAGWSPVAEFSDIVDSGPVVTLAELMETPVFAATAEHLRVRVDWTPPEFVWPEMGDTQTMPAVAA